MVLIAVAILLFQPRSAIIFKQNRIGVNKEEFVIYKFTTMKNNQITPLGKVLRLLGLDELPQLINIIKGEMSFVGPRPLTQFDIERLGWDTPHYNKRWSVKPGITGAAQLSKVCDAQLSIKNDLWYIEHKSLVVDVRIIMESLLVPILGKRTK
jgi:lipopolysaccharide/colanic/teichoic acid biosynthesis glycosyltransferase